MTAAAQFREAIASAGLTPPDDINGDGKLHRFSTNGKPRDDAGWYVFHDDERPAGRFGCNRSSIDASWKAENQREYTTEEKQAWRNRMRELEAQREAERQAATAKAAATAASMWDAARADDIGHPYAERKKIAIIGARRLKDMLLVPLRHGPGELVGLQIIQPDGARKFLTGTPATGAYMTLGKPTKNGPIVICEGWATGCSIHMATGHCTVVAFSSGQLTAVAKKIRSALAIARIIIAADDDAFTDGNPGITAAAEAAVAINAAVVAPEWTGERGQGTDFNDLHCTEGLDAVRACFEAAGNGAPQTRPAPVAEDKPGSVLASKEANNSGSKAVASSLSAAGDAVEPPKLRAPTREVSADDVDEPQDDDELIFATKPMEAAELFHGSLPERGRIIFWRDQFYSWQDSRYVVRDRVWIEQRLYHWCSTRKTLKVNMKTGDSEIVAFDPTAKKIGDIVHALRAVCYADLPEPQVWLVDHDENDIPAHEIIAFRNGFLHWPTRTFMPSTHRLWVTSSLDFDYTEHAADPIEWTRFLDNLFPTDPESIQALGEMFGYLLTDDTSQQKMFMLIGPPRSGKGTILRILESLVGSSNRVSPSLAGIGTNFGIQPLIGKRVAMISDARLSGRADQQPIVENLLRISGEDSLTVDRKQIAAWSGKLPTRFIMASNEIPAFSDASAALANRFIMFKFTTSFLGREDSGLTNRLLRELPGILLWALDGLERLSERGHLIRPASADEIALDMIEQTSPIRSFVADKCIISETADCDRDELYRIWREWCTDQGRDHPGAKVHFGRQLAAAFPAIKRTQPRESGTRLNLYSGIRIRAITDLDGRDDELPY